MDSDKIKIPGSLVVDNDKLQRLKTRVSKLTNFKYDSFPGAQPISFTLDNLGELEKEDYYVSEKADGIRCLLLLIKDENSPEAYFIDRKNEYYYLKMGVPTRVWGSWRTDTILDGEIVLERDPLTNERHTVYLVFDCICMDGYFLSNKEYNIRLGFVNDHIITPISMHKNLLKQTKMLKISIALKHLETSYNIKKLLDLMKNLNHKNDGIVFTSRKSPYVYGTCNTMLKWKTHDENTVDFKLDIVDNSTYKLYVRNKTGLVYVGDMKDPNDLNKRLNSGDVVECRFDLDSKQWVYTRTRTDKNDCNFINTYYNILESISKSVDIEEIVAKADAIKNSWKHRNSKTATSKKYENGEPMANDEEYYDKIYNEYSDLLNNLEKINPYKIFPNTTTDYHLDLM